MREKFTAILLFTVFIAIVCSQLFLQNNPKVLKIITPVMLQVDLNGNNIFDDGEMICVNGIKSFTSNMPLAYITEDTKFKLPYEKAIAIGYLADEFANDTLLYKNIRLHFTGEAMPECKFADIYLDKQNYGNILYNHGFGIKNGEVFEEAYKNALAAAGSLKFVILNRKSNKYHTLDCKYGHTAHDSVVLLEKELPDDSKPCKFCHISKINMKPTEKIISSLPASITDGNLKLILTDFTAILKPDKNCSHLVCRELVSLIDNSKKSIDIALYGWSDIPKVNNALFNAQNRGVRIRIVYDTGYSSENYYKDTKNFVSLFKNTRSDEIIGNKTLTNMHMHNKFIIFDNKKVYTGSMNFSTTGLSGFNHNNVIIINSESVANLYTAEFEQMFEGKFHTLKSETHGNTNIKNGARTISVFFSPQDKGLLNGVIPLVQKAENSIYMPVFLITHDELVKVLIEAKQRGVDVRIITDAVTAAMPRSKVKILRENNIPVKIENYAGKMHSKVMIIDDRYLVTGSANFSNSAENKNDENTLIIDSPRLAKFYNEFFKYFWEIIPDKYLKQNVPAESIYSIGSCSDETDNDFDGKIDLADDGCKR